MTRLTFAVLALVLAASPVAAADLPAICLKNAPMGDMNMGTMGSTEPAAGDQAHQDLMAGMADMNKNMMAGSTAVDIDVAFICSMIPHHQGAIAMAKAELAHGDDPWAKQLAHNIIAAQEKEIADMTAWLSKQPQ